MDNLKESKDTLSNLQLELLKSLHYIATEKQLHEVKSLLRFYFASQLGASIDKAESEKKYTADIYENWLKDNIISRGNESPI